MRTDDFAFGLAGGFTTVVATALLIAGILPANERFARLFAMAVVITLLAMVIGSRRAVAGVTVVAMLVFVGFLVHRFGVLTGDPHAWLSAPVMVFAATLGRMIRAARVKNASRTARPV